MTSDETEKTEARVAAVRMVVAREEKTETGNGHPTVFNSYDHKLYV